MKKITTTIFVLILSIQVMYPAVFTMWFYANRAALAKAYCENKTRPMLHCDGQCYLAKKIRAAEEKKSSEAQPGMLNVWQETAPAVLVDMSLQLQVLPAEIFYAPFPQHGFTHAGYLVGVFKPPSDKA